MDYTKIDTYLEEHIPALLEDLSRLVAIDSERREALPGMPFGRGPGTRRRSGPWRERRRSACPPPRT